MPDRTTTIAGLSQQKKIFTGKRVDFYVKRGDTFDYDYKHTFVNASGVKQNFDFASATGVMQIKRNKTDAVAYRHVVLTLNSSLANMHISASQMQTMDAGRYFYDFEIKDVSSNQVTKTEGIFVVSQDVSDFLAINQVYFDLMMSSEYSSQIQPHSRPEIVLSSEFLYELISVLYKSFDVISMDSEVLNQLMTIQVEDRPTGYLGGKYQIFLDSEFGFVPLLIADFPLALDTEWSARID